MKTVVFTIVTRNRLHLARVLMQSVAAAFPAAERHALVIDPADGFFDPAAEPFAVTLGPALGLPEFSSYAFVNDALSLCCLLKPAYAQYLLENTAADTLIYADSDMRCHAPPEGLAAVLQHAPVVFTPHALAPLGPTAPRRDSDLMRSGAFNAGFFALRRGESATVFLRWWLDVMCGQRQLDAVFAHDQQWLSLASVYFPWIHALRDPGYNVAYWNIHERPLGRQPDGRLTAGGRPLAFFHYSFFDPATPDLLAHRPPIVVPTHDAILHELLCDYVQSLAQAGAATCQAWPYGYGQFTDGTPVTAEQRRYYLERVWADSAHAGNPFEPGFASRHHRGLRSVYALHQPLPRALRRLRHWMRKISPV